jgi:diadenosine tetraphosphate (Ap4A) HIT family hydrolase
VIVLGLSETGRIVFDRRRANIPASMTATAYTNDSFVIEPSRDCPIAGYLIVSPIIPASSLSELRREALDSLGATLAAATRAIEKVIHPERVYCALFAEEKHSVHFHLFPRSRWVLSRYAAAHQVERDVSGPQLFDWARRTFHSPAPANYDELTEAIFRELRPNG